MINSGLRGNLAWRWYRLRLSRPRQILSRRRGLSSTERRELSLRVMGQSEQGQRLREGFLEKRPLGRWRWLARIAAGEAEGRAAGTERVAKGRCEGAGEDGGEGGWHGGLLDDT